MSEPVNLKNLVQSYSNKQYCNSLVLNKTSNIAISNKLYKVICDTKRTNKNFDEKKAQSIASYIESKIGNPAGRMFYLKCAWNLAEPFINDLIVRSLKKNSPAKYFCSAASREMKKNGE